MQNQPALLAPMRWGGARALIFTVPYTDIEILALMGDGGMRGIIYRPHKLTKPVPWLSTCPHCQRGEQRECPIKVRRSIQALCSIKPERPDGYRFTLPNHYHLYTRKNTRGWVIGVKKPRSTMTLWARALAGEDESFEGSIRDFRSPMLLRTLKLFFSAREPNEREIRACLRPLRDHDPSSLKPSQRTPCRVCSWITLELSQPHHPST